MESLSHIEELRAACPKFLGNMSIEQSEVFLSMFSAEEIEQAHADLAPDIQEQVRVAVNTSLWTQETAHRTEKGDGHLTKSAVSEKQQVEQHKPVKAADIPEVNPARTIENTHAVTAEIIEIRQRIVKLAAEPVSELGSNYTQNSDTENKPAQLEAAARTRISMERQTLSLTSEAEVPQESVQRAADKQPNLVFHARDPVTDTPARPKTYESLADTRAVAIGIPDATRQFQIEPPAIEMIIRPAAIAPEAIGETEQSDPTIEDMELPEPESVLPRISDEDPDETEASHPETDWLEPDALTFAEDLAPLLVPAAGQEGIAFEEIAETSVEPTEAILDIPALTDELVARFDNLRQTNSDGILPATEVVKQNDPDSMENESVGLLKPYIHALRETVSNNEPLLPEFSDAVARLKLVVELNNSDQTATPELTEQIVGDMIIILKTLGCKDPVETLRAYSDSRSLPELLEDLLSELPDFSKLIDYQQHLLQALSQALSRSDRRHIIAQLLRNLLFVQHLQVAGQAA